LLCAGLALPNIDNFAIASCRGVPPYSLDWSQKFHEYRVSAVAGDGTAGKEHHKGLHLEETPCRDGFPKLELDNMDSKMVAPKARARAADVARSLVGMTSNGMEQLRLQKLLYYCQAGSLAWTLRPMFLDRIEAWANGPVIVPIWNAHRYESWISEVPEGKPLVDPNAEMIATQIYKAFDVYTAQQLSDMTHAEEPWLQARRNLPKGASGSSPISIDSMRRYYSRAWGSGSAVG
jgi:uncharacterized phage-associated protein